MNRIIYAAPLLALACQNPNAGSGTSDAALNKSHAQATAGSGTPRIDRSHVVARWEGGQMTYGQFFDEKQSIYRKAYNKYLTELYENEQKTLEQMVVQSLVEKKAKAEGKDAESYLRDHAQAAPLTDEEVSAFYAQNAQRIQAPFEQAQAQIRAHLTQQKQREAFANAIRAVVDEAKLKIEIPPPPFENFKFDLSKAPGRGKDGAKVSVVVFSDFQCPYCARAVPELDAIEKAYPNDVEVHFMHYPLSFHPFALPSAIAAVCAQEQGKFWEFHDQLFAKQSSLSQETFKAVADELKLDSAKFLACMAKPETEKQVQADMAQGEQAGVEGTPSFFVNGQPFTGGVPNVDALKPYVERKI